MIKNNSEQPVFLPLVDDRSVISLKDEVDGFVIEAATINWRNKTFEELRKNFSFYFIDPSTGRIPYEYARSQNFNKLSYAIEKENISKIYSDPQFRLDSLVIPCLDFQIENGSSLIIPPYLHFEDTNSQKFVTNSALIADSLRNLKTKEVSLPVYAMLNFSSSLLTNNLHLGQIITTYMNFDDDLAGYIVQIDNLDDRGADEYTLESLAELIFQLSSNKKDVLIQHMGGFAEILSMAGLTAHIGAVARRERFSLKDYDDPDTEIRGRGYEWTYVPEIFNYKQDADLEKINYLCRCDFCKGSLPRGAPNSKKHFITAKCARTNRLRSLSKEKLYEKLKKSIFEAQQLTKKMKDAEIVVRDQYLPRWLSVLEKINHWERSDDKQKLDALLNAIDDELNDD